MNGVIEKLHALFKEQTNVIARGKNFTSFCGAKADISKGRLNESKYIERQRLI